MRLILCADLLLGGECTDMLDIQQSHHWNEKREQKVDSILAKANAMNADLLLVVGSLFGMNDVPESFIDGLFQSIRKAENLQVLCTVNAEEMKRIGYRSDIPDQFHMLAAGQNSHYESEAGSVDYENDHLVIQSGTASISCFRHEADGIWYLKQDDGSAREVPRFEPQGYESAKQGIFGYGILTRETEGWNCETVEQPAFHFEEIEVEIDPEDGQPEILLKINQAISRMEPDTFLRIILSGKCAFGTVIHKNALKKHVQNRIFYAEVYDYTSMDIDESQFAYDISLRSEFIRLALKDTSLSAAERNRLISTGWDALNGKEDNAE